MRLPFLLRDARPYVGALLALIAVLTLAPAAGSSSSATPEYGSSDWRQVSAGGAHSCGIRTTGRLYCWGLDHKGQLGNGDVSTTSQPTPVEVVGGWTDGGQVSAGNSATCAVRRNGRLYCWGEDLEGQLGNGSMIGDRSVPTQVVGARTDWSSVSNTGAHTCALRRSGTAWCWGSDNEGQLGNGATTGSREAPVAVAGQSAVWTSLQTGGSTSCGIRTSGRLYCWGFDIAGGVGNGPGNEDVPSPAQVSGGATNWASVAVGSAHTCARRTTGR